MTKPASEKERSAWKEHIEQQQASNLSIEKWCLQNQIRPHAFHYWKEKLFPKKLQKSSFTELNMKRSDEISLQTRGVHICLTHDCDPFLRKQLINLFAEGLC